VARSWAPWLLPVALVLGVASAALPSAVVAIALAAICVVSLVVARLRYLKAHPPNPELVHKPFWKI
jgi:hypothetical protein